MSAKTMAPRRRGGAEVGLIKGYTLSADVLQRVWLERLRQKDLLRQGNIPFDCASPIVCNDRKLRALAEEFGEIAKAIDDLEAVRSIPLHERKPEAARILKAAAHLREEITQLTAIGIAWLESLEDGK